MSIISKASLSLAQIATGTGALGMIEIQPDGAVAASDGRLLIAIGPVRDEVAQAVPLEGKAQLPRAVTLSAATATGLQKQIPRDTLFKGLLEHVSLVESGTGFQTVINTGKQKLVSTLRAASEKWVEWKAILRTAFTKQVLGRVLVNRKSLEKCIDVLKGSCPYSGEFEAVLIEFREGGIMTIRARNNLTGQAVLATFAVQGAKEVELEKWEKELIIGKTGQKAAIRKS
jgi:hypothetical protein